MTIKEVGKDYGVAMYYGYDGENDIWGWTWALECGYQCWDGTSYFDNPSDCEENLKSFLKTWTGPTK